MLLFRTCRFHMSTLNPTRDVYLNPPPDPDKLRAEIKRFATVFYSHVCLVLFGLKCWQVCFSHMYVLFHSLETAYGCKEFIHVCVVLHPGKENIEIKSSYMYALLHSRKKCIRKKTKLIHVCLNTWPEREHVKIKSSYMYALVSIRKSACRNQKVI